MNRATKTCPPRLLDFATLRYFTTMYQRHGLARRAPLKLGLDFDTALNALLTLSAVTEAVEDGLITHNPALRSGKLLKRPETIEESELAIFTPEEEGLLLETVRRERPLFYPMALTFFHRPTSGRGTWTPSRRSKLSQPIHLRATELVARNPRHTQEREGQAGGHVAGSRKGARRNGSSYRTWRRQPLGIQRLNSSSQATWAEPGGSLAIWPRIGSVQTVVSDGSESGTATTGYA